MAEGWRPGIPPLTAADVPAALAAHPAVVVYFWASWNGVDRQFAPVLEAVRPEFAGRVEFRAADVDDAGLAAFCEACGVVNVPALGCFVRGRRVKTVVGSRPAEVLRAEFAALLGGPRTPNPAPRPISSHDGFPGWLNALGRCCCRAWSFAGRRAER